MEAALLRFAAKLVTIPGESGAEGEVARAVKEEMEALGYDEVVVDAAGNVLGKVTGRRSHRGKRTVVLFDAHLDTVGVNDGDAWHYPPYGGVVEDGKLYGRGAADMRGALASMVHGIAAVNRDLLEGEAWVCGSVNEEVLEGAGLKVALGLAKPDCVVIGESTQLNLAIGQRGRMELLLEVQGKACHSAWPSAGMNAVSGMARAWLALEQHRLPEHPRLGPAIAVLTDVVSTPYPGLSVVPYLCRATLDRRSLPGESAAEAARELERVAAQVAGMPVTCRVVDGESATYTGYRLGQPKHFPAWELPEDHPLVHRAVLALRDAGLKPAISTYKFCTNGSSSAGELGIPTLGFGPGHEAQAHTADEFIEVDQLHAAARGYQALAVALTRESRQLSLFGE
ncbi:MAG: YgeY family selenium metabolism-linked hydrolase [Bacillota bacterium]